MAVSAWLKLGVPWKEAGRFSYGLAQMWGKRGKGKVPESCQRSNIKNGVFAKVAVN